jgi:peroxiredoxin
MSTPPSPKEHTVRADIIPGGTFPDYELTDHTKARRRLNELQGIDPMILVLSRGGFCPKDHQQHLELAANYPKIRVSYTQIVTISTDNILKTNEFRDSVGAQWTFLSDASRKIQKDLDIQEYTDSYYNPMIPYTLVLKPGLVIFSIYNGYWFWGRPSFEDLRRDLREGDPRDPPGLGPGHPRPPRELGGRRPLHAPPVPASRPHADRVVLSRGGRYRVRPASMATWTSSLKCSCGATARQIWSAKAGRWSGAGSWVTARAD